MRFVRYIPGLLAVAAAAAAVVFGKRALDARDPLRPATEGLGPLRARILSIISEVVPSRYGDARFALLAPGYRPDDPALPEGFTTCGYLPLYIGRKLQIPKGIASGGIEGLRTAGKAAGAWVEADGTNRPKPGDLYGLSATPGGILVHVGSIVDSSGDTWTTADAGQGARDAQEAQYVKRGYDASAVTLGGANGPRHLAGWIDMDRYPRPGVA